MALNKARLGLLGVAIAGGAAALAMFAMSGAGEIPENSILSGSSGIMSEISPSGQDIMGEDGTSQLRFEEVEFTRIGKESATISFVTSKPVQCAVDYGKAEPGGTLGRTATDGDTKMSMAHKHHTVKLTGLEPDTKYQYRLRSISEGLPHTSDIRTFTTAPKA